MSSEGAEDIGHALRLLTERTEALETRVRRLDGLEPRVEMLEVGLLRVERQLHLVFEQGQSAARALGEQRRLLEDVLHAVQHLSAKGAL